MKRLWALLAVCVVVLASCGGSSDKGSGGEGGGGDGATGMDCPLSALDDADGPVELAVWYGGLQGNPKEVITDIVADYNKSQDKVKVTASDQGAAYDQVLAKYTQAIGQDRYPNVVYAENNMAQFLMDSETIIPGQTCADEGVVPLDHILPAVKAYYTLDGVYVPTALNVSTPQLYYNQKHYEDAGLELKAPGTLAEVRADAEKLQAAGIADLEWPVSMTVNRWFFETWLGGAGVEMVDNDNGHDGHATKATFDTPEALELLTELQSMYDDGLIAKVSNTPGNIDQYLNLAQGKSTMVFETSTAATTIEAFLGGKLSAEDLAAGNIEGLSASTTIIPGFGEMPGMTEPGYGPVSGGAFYVTNAGSELEQAAAMDFMRYMNEIPQQVKWHVEGSYLPSNDQVADDPAVKEFWKGEVAGLSLQVAAGQLAAMTADNAGPMVGPSDQYNDIIQKMLESVYLKGEDPAKALTRAEADVTAAIRNYNEENGF